jgi:hypothetical protein
MQGHFSPYIIFRSDIKVRVTVIGCINANRESANAAKNWERNQSNPFLTFSLAFLSQKMTHSSESSSRKTMIPSFLYGSSPKTLPVIHQIINSGSASAPVPGTPPSPSMRSTGSAGFMIPSPKEPFGKIEMYSPAFYAACTAGGILSCGLTHMSVTPLDLVKCNMQVFFLFL